jgi:hypothetical protein
MKLKVLVTMAALMSTTAYAARGFKFDKTNFSGTGCKAGTVSETTSPDGKALSILFDDFIVEVPQMDGDNDNDFENELNQKGRKNNPNKDHKRCAMLINADVPEGEIIDSIKIKLDMRGSAYIEEDAKVVFQSVLRSWKGRKNKFRGRKGGQVIARKVWNENNYEDEWLVSKTITIPVRTGCHARQRNKVQFVLNNALVAKMKKRGNGEGMAYSSIDSHDFGGKLQVSVVTKPCGSKYHGNSRNNGRARVSDNSRNPNDRNHGETRVDRDARRRNGGNNGRGRGGRRSRRRP